MADFGDIFSQIQPWDGSSWEGSPFELLLQSLGALPGAGGKKSTDGQFQSGFRPPQAGGFPITPQQNYWQGNQFMAPGVSSSPLMSSDILQRFPQLASIAGGGQAPPAPQPSAGFTQQPSGQSFDTSELLARLQQNPHIAALLKKFGNF